MVNIWGPRITIWKLSSHIKHYNIVVMTPNETSIVSGEHFHPITDSSHVGHEGHNNLPFKIPSRTGRNKLKSIDGRRKDVRLGMLAGGALNLIL
ncbi:hypothetical protein SLA2020_026800 [Shorea laevis]